MSATLGADVSWARTINFDFPPCALPAMQAQAQALAYSSTW